MGKKIVKSIKVDEDLLADLEVIMRKENRPFSNLVSLLLMEYVENWKKDKKKDEQ